ncbi:MAG: hypothetical protein KGZ51_07775 [Erysipelothrix sp.]|nr:hypothetical protein [Erysipelothrix sp.]
MINDISKLLIKYHHFYPYKVYRSQIKAWRASWLHQSFIKSATPSSFDIANALMMDIALENKEGFQRASEAIRHDFYDLWQDMEYAKRNQFLIQYLESYYSNVKVFNFEDESIVVPFFDVLLNALIMKRPAVFDLPQYFKLYKDYKENVVNPLSLYGLSLLQSDFYSYKLVASNDNNHVLYDYKQGVLIHCEGMTLLKEYPLAKIVNDNDLIFSLAYDILNQDLVSFTQKGCDFQLFHPKLAKKCQKALAKHAKGKKK